MVSVDKLFKRLIIEERETLNISKNFKNFNLKKAQKSVFYTAESRFSLTTGLKFLSIPFLTSIFISLILYMFMEMNLLFFKANGFGSIQELEGAFYDFVLSGILPFIPIYFLFLCGFFFVGVYISKLLMRPFYSLTKYCEDVVDGYRGVYEPDEFSDLRLLTRISEFFFSHMETQIKNNKLEGIEVPEQFKRVHAPKFEKAYFLHFSLIILITLICFLFLTYMMTYTIHENLISLAIGALKSKDGNHNSFFLGQNDIMIYALSGIYIISTGVYVWLAFHLYNKVSGAAFGIFSTLRSFMKGNFKARIHIIGYEHLRNSTRIINRYLDYLEKKYANSTEIKNSDNIVPLKDKMD